MNRNSKEREFMDSDAEFDSEEGNVNQRIGDEVDSDSDSEQQESSGSESESESETAYNAGLDRIMTEISTLPLDKQLEMREKMGSKEFDRIYYRGIVKQNKSKSKKQARDGNEIEKEVKAEKLLHRNATKQADQKDKYRRESKKGPIVLSSKKPIRSRNLLRLQLENEGKTTAKHQGYDPRFENTSGRLNNELFEKSYGFLKEYQNEELEEMEKMADKLRRKNKESNMNSNNNDGKKSAKGKKMKRHEYLLQQELEQKIAKLKQKQKDQDKRDELQQITREHRKREKQMVEERGKRPYYLKKSQIKDIQRAKEFEKLAGTKKLDDIIERKRKRKTSKQHVKIPRLKN